MVAGDKRKGFRRDQEEDSPLDKKQTAAIWFNQLTQGIYITLPYTLAVYMVRHFEGENGNEESIGRNTGLLAAAASAAQAMTSYLWGTVSDHTGRKPVLMVGNISACLSILALGMAPNYSVAILSRFVGGLFTSSTGVAIKTIIAESCDATNQAKAMGYMTAGWGVGTIAGPTIGGFLANPCDSFASGTSLCAPGSWLMERPFLLPCLVSALMAFLAWLSNLFMMSETHPKFMPKYAQLNETDTEDDSKSSSAGHQLLASHSAPQELQLSTLTHHTDQKQSLKGHKTSPKHADCRNRVPYDPSAVAGKSDVANQPDSYAEHGAQAGNGVPLGQKAVHFESSQSATGAGQLQLLVSSSDSSSSGILAVRSASAPLETELQEGTEHEQAGEMGQVPTPPQRLQPRPSLDLVLPDTGMDCNMGAIPASLEAAAQKLSRQSRPVPGLNPQSQSLVSRCSDLSSKLGSTGMEALSEDDSESGQLLLQHELRASQDSEWAQDHVIDVTDTTDLSEESDKPWYRQNLVTVCLAGGGLITLIMNYLDELAPVFASAQPSAGGLGMPEHEFAWPLTFGGLVLMLYSLCLYPKNQKRWGYQMCCKIGLLMSIPSSMVLPFAHTFVRMQWLMQACMFLGIGVRSIAKIMALASSTIIINTIAPIKQIGSVNGASQSINALARAIGPFVAGIAWGFSADSTVPGKQYLPFLGSVVGVIMTHILYMYIVLPD